MVNTLTLAEKLKCCIIDRNEMWLQELIQEHGINALVLIDSEHIFELAESLQADSNKMRPLSKILSETYLADEFECLQEIRKLRALMPDDDSILSNED
jgi:hypothetical protein